MEMLSHPCVWALGGLVLLQIVLFVATRIHRKRGARSALQTQKQLYSEEHAYRLVRPAEFPDLDHAWYQWVTETLGGLGFTYLADIENLTVKQAMPSADAFIRVFIGENDKWHGEPLYDAIVKKLRMMDVAGATVYRGILGYGAKGHEHKRSVLHPMRDLPIMVSVIDSPEKIAAATETLETMLEDGLIVTSDVEMTRLVRSRTVTEASDATSNPR